MHLWTLVGGQVSRMALANPLQPSVKTTSGAGIGAMRVDHALEFSDLAMYQETILSPLQHISTTRSRGPDSVDVERTVQLAVGDGHGPDLPELGHPAPEGSPPPGIMACEPFERSRPSNSSNLAAVSSYLSVVDAPQAVHLQHWDPDEVLPLRLVRPPQQGQYTAFMSTFSGRVFNGFGRGYLPAGTMGNRTHILSERVKASRDLNE